MWTFFKKTDLAHSPNDLSLSVFDFLGKTLSGRHQLDIGCLKVLGQFFAAMKKYTFYWLVEHQLLMRFSCFGVRLFPIDSKRTSELRGKGSVCLNCSLRCIALELRIKCLRAELWESWHRPLSMRGCIWFMFDDWVRRVGTFTRGGS